MLLKVYTATENIHFYGKGSLEKFLTDKDIKYLI